jgi:hypothetical protein
MGALMLKESAFKDPKRVSSDALRLLKQSLEYAFNSDGEPNEEALECRNGPYNHREPALRSLCHFGVIVNYLQHYSEYFEGLDIEVNLGNAAVNIESRIFRAIDNKKLIFRDQEGFDCGNGVIGIAWLLEYLLSRGDRSLGRTKSLLDFLDSEIAFDSCKSLFKLQVTDRTEERDVDKTFNHQLWLISVLVHLPEHEIDTALVRKFIDSWRLSICYSDGTLFHKTRQESSSTSIKNALRRLFYYPKSNSYQIFNLIAIDRILRGLKMNESDLLPFVRRDFSAWQVFLLFIEKHGLTYNPSGFYISNLEEKFPHRICRKIQFWLVRLTMKYSWTDFIIDRNRLISRVYETLL